MTGAAPPITIGLPVFNGERFLAAALDSILSQTFADFRLVVSDNASTDATAEICRDYAARDSRIAYSRSDVNRGAAWNYNHAFAQCESPFFKWAAADDLIAPTFLERCFEVLTVAPAEVVLVYTRTLIVDEDGRPLREHDDRLDLRSPKPHERLGHLVSTIVLGNVAFGLMRADALRRTRGHGNFPSADYVLLAELALIGQFWEIPEPLFVRREHAGTSRQSNPTSEDLTRWLDPTSRPVTHERRRLLREYLAGIAHADLGTRERLVSYASFMRAWARRSSLPVLALRRLRGRVRPG